MIVRIEVRRKADNPTGVDFFVGGKKVANAVAERIWTEPSGRVTVRAVIVYTPTSDEPTAEEYRQDEDRYESGRGARKTRKE